MQEQDVTQVLRAVEAGEPGAADELFQLVYGELRRLANACFADERRDHTLEPTGLVHEAYMKLLGRSDLSFASRAGFFALAGRVMRLVLVDHARGKLAQKRGGGRKRVTLAGVALSPEIEELDLLAIDEALTQLAELDERKARLVELRFFAGLGEAQAAEALGVSRGTASADWRFARAWLMSRLHPSGPGGSGDGS
ncbi:MAG: ECF-type sigma factor [Planctomycetota bacterium]